MADEGVERQIVDRLREDGHDVSYVAEIQRGISDETVRSISMSEGRVLLTWDKDFCEMVFRQRKTTPGVVLIRLHGLPSFYKAEAVANAVRQRSEEFLGSFSVISPASIRIRRSL